MRIVASGERVERELVAYLEKHIARMSGNILQGVPTNMYEVRCAELRMLTDLLAELPAIIKKAKD